MANNGSCMYFVKRKNRYCHMSVGVGKSYCGEHQQDFDDAGDWRVKCPLDPTHTCYQSKLTKHLSVCNAKQKLDAQPAFIVKGINMDDEIIVVSPRVPLSQLYFSDHILLKTVIRKIHTAYDKLPDFSQAILQHEVLKDKLRDESGVNARKHLLQNASLLGHLERADLVRDNTCFIEFGAGRALLTYWLGQIIKDKSNSCVLLVDRSSYRHKSDNKLRKEENGLVIKRVRADIADLQLNRIAEIQPIEYKVGIAKHLCGTATDYAIRCLAKSIDDDPKVNVRGLVFAFCCHHKCEYWSYVGKEYLRQCDFTPNEFSVLCSIVSWATCGIHLKNNDSSGLLSLLDECYTQLDEREIIGRKAKVLLNWGRLSFLRSIGFEAELFYYTSTEVSPENMCIVATRKS